MEHGSVSSRPFRHYDRQADQPTRQPTDLPTNQPTERHTECSLNIVFFPKILKYFGLWPFSVSLCFLCFPSVSVCAHTPVR